MAGHFKRSVAVFTQGSAEPRIIEQRVRIPNPPRVTPAAKPRPSNAERRALRRERMLAKKRARHVALKAKRPVTPTSPRPSDYRLTRDAFLASDEWKRLRYDTLRRHGARCLACNTDRASGKVMHVDHIKPMWTHWHLRADPQNLQVLCEDCNLGKGAWDDTDWR